MTLKDCVKTSLIVLVAVTLFSIGLVFYDTVIKKDFHIVEVKE